MAPREIEDPTDHGTTTKALLRVVVVQVAKLFVTPMTFGNFTINKYHLGDRCGDFALLKDLIRLLQPGMGM